MKIVYLRRITIIKKRNAKKRKNLRKKLARKEVQCIVGNYYLESLFSDKSKLSNMINEDIALLLFHIFVFFKKKVH